MPPPWSVVIGDSAVSGGQADVFRVARADDSGEYALKRLKNPNRAERFAREIGAMRALRAAGSMCVPPIIDDGQDSKRRPYYVIPWCEAGSLDAVVNAATYRDDPAGGLHLLISIADGLAEIHKAGYAHRDLKPGNILLCDGGIWLADFGLVLDVNETDRVTETLEAVGSRLYIAPENGSGFNEEVDQRPAISTLSQRSSGRCWLAQLRPIASGR
jgi:serine/threonine protein kinase